MIVSYNQADELDRSSLPNQLFLIAILLGVGLRLIASVWGDIGVYVDGASRIAMAMRWAEHPAWQGLSGVWPPTHIYVLGILIRLWNQPVLLAKLIGFFCGVATLFALRNTVRHRFGPTVAALSALLLAVYWTHIWLSSSYWVEVPYLLFVLLAVNFAEKTNTSFDWKHAFACGLFLSLAMLLRNEGLLLFVIFTLWFLLRIRKLGILALFVVLPGAVMAWYLIEPTLHGYSYFDYFKYVTRSKETENLVGNISRRDALIQWILMLSAAPTLIVAVPGLYELWKNRRRALTDLLAWMFVAQVGFYFFLTLTSAWRPQLRYLMIQFVNLLPYAAVGWLKIMQRFSIRYALAAMLALMIVMQSVAWWIGRNNRLPGGWLPMQVITSSQETLDQWVGKINTGEQPPLKIVSLVPGPRAERWALEHSFVVNRLTTNRSSMQELDVHVQPEILRGVMPAQVADADVVLIDSNAVFYPVVLGAIGRQKPDTPIRRLHPHIDAILLSERARSELMSVP
ncbi:MAG TPA: glycosyltransferase family 39 protein [Pyrinomonadaceae bacterium]|nr:glycosyltransferase family 39 protein [Pyrinomonadaceae bacterium]